MPAPRPEAKRPPQFTLTSLLVVMAVVSLAAAPGYYLMRAAKGEQGMLLIGMIVLLTGPMFMMIALSLLLSLLGWWKGR